MKIMEMKEATLSDFICAAYRWKQLKKICIMYCNNSEGGPFYSLTLRKILKKYHGVTVGHYSYGECTNPGSWPSGVTVGRYVSVGENVKVFLRNHPMERLSMHPFFYNHKLGYVDSDTITSSYLEIAHDVWIGDSVIITPSCKKIGLGAVIGAGSVVTKDVPPFSIVAGNPARKIRDRFESEIVEKICASHWWNKSINDLKHNISKLIKEAHSEIGDLQK